MLREGGQEREQGTGAEAEEEAQRHVHAEELLHTLAQRLEAGAAAGRRRANAARAEDEHEGARADEAGHRERPPEAELPHHRLAEQRGERGGRETGEPEDAQGPAAPLHGHQVHDVDVARHEERGEGEPLHAAEHRVKRDRARHHEPRRRHHEEDRPQPHEEAPAQTVDPHPDQGLEENTRDAVGRLHQSHVRLAPAHLLHVDGEQEEPVHAHEEEEVGEHRLDERAMHQELGGRRHARCGGGKANSKMAAAMRRVEYSTRARA
jgi:hypothetical protein